MGASRHIIANGADRENKMVARIPARPLLGPSTHPPGNSRESISGNLVNTELLAEIQLSLCSLQHFQHPHAHHILLHGAWHQWSMQVESPIAAEG